MDKTIKRFLTKIRFTEDESNCWLWLGGVNSNGYGCFGFDGLTFLAHRFMWIIKHSYDAEGIIHHRCKERRCCNPDHLVEVSSDIHSLLHTKLSSKDKEEIIQRLEE